MKINECGRSMTEMLGVLAIISVLGTGGLVGYSKAMYKYKMHKTIGFVSDAIIDYELFVKQNFGIDKNLKKQNMAQKLQEYGLVPNCEATTSIIAGNAYQVCRAPLGEISPRLSIQELSEGRQHTYELHVTFLQGAKQACSDFLVRNWDVVVPSKLWKKGSIHVASNTKDEVVYSATVKKLDISNVAATCEEVCSDSAYCSVVFNFKGIKY
ncbi:MAG: hypothetical protein IJ870_04005 [Alphaproteobacteria bacterium]|nr:hypothetical protein [Alphaproteobacteria bacterium]